MATRPRALVIFALLVPGCVRKDNHNYCPGLNPDDNCAEGDAGIRSCGDDGPCLALGEVCDTLVKVCVQCTAARSSACTGPTPICGTDDRCRSCRSHADCTASGVCLPDGACANAADVAYVTAPDGADSSTCSMAAPCRTIAAALATPRPYLKLHGMIDEAVTINNRNAVVLADPGTVLTRSGGGNILVVSGGSRVAVVDLAIDGATGTGAGVALTSGADQAVTLSHVSMSRNNGTGGAVTVAGGTINIHRSVISGNTGGGISITNADFDLENNVITKNGNAVAAGGIVLEANQNGGTHILSFNTISGNVGPMNLGAGVDCSALNQDFRFSNNIIYGNATTTTGQVNGARCSWTYSDIGPGPSVTGTGNTSSDPMFVDATGGDFHLRSGSPAIDQADPNTTLDVDVDGDFRPQGGRRDIGADEYTPGK